MVTVQSIHDSAFECAKTLKDLHDPRAVKMIRVSEKLAAMIRDEDTEFNNIPSDILDDYSKIVTEMNAEGIA